MPVEPEGLPWSQPCVSELGPDVPEAKVAIAGRTDRGILRDLLGCL